ncbi:MAG: helix-turn-helix domain-containing protein [Acidobacteriota bacterium]|nr:helix-turn-helix domain-containing protein [Acidobacteriota bacterium]
MIPVPETVIEDLAERVKQKLLLDFPPPEQPDEEVLEMRRKLARIHEKERISVGEAALLLNCSDGHIRNLVKRAKKRHSKNPIPYCDLDGVTVFGREALLAWADSRSGQPRAD